MTIAELQNILQSDKQLSIDKIKQIIYELKNDMVMFKKDPYEAGWNNGSTNAFDICLDLLDKLDQGSVNLEERVHQLEMWREKLEIQSKVESFMMSMQYGCLGKPFNKEYLHLELNKMFGTGDYTDTDSVKQDGYKIETSFTDEKEADK